MQNPPPGPPSGPPPGYPQQPYQPAASSVDKKTGSFLAYLLWWITGIIMLFVGKGDPDIKYHAAQSIIFFGALSVVETILRFAAFATLISVVYYLVWLFGIVIWIVCMAKAWSGGGARFPIPLVGGVVTPYAEQLANSVT
jgi:uncharacterized membrane protein